MSESYLEAIPAAGNAELWLISDFPIDDKQLQQIRRLFGERTSDADVHFSANRKVCHWPLRVGYESGAVHDPAFHVYLCAGFLKQRRSVVARIRELGCNLELCLHIPGLTKYFSMASATMKQLADLEISFSLMPPVAAATQ